MTSSATGVGGGPLRAPPRRTPWRRAALPWIPQKKSTERITKLTERDDLRAVAQEVFADVGERPPGPRHQITIADVEDYSRRWVENRDAGRFHTTDADIVEDSDGRPLAVSRSTDVFTFSSLAIDQADAHRLGITAGQYPGIRIINPRNTKENDR